MIEMRMADCDRVDLLQFVALGIRGIALDPRVKQQHLSRVERDLKRRVSKPVDSDHSEPLDATRALAGTCSPSPTFASPGIETGILPVIGIVPSTAFAAAISEVCDVLNVAAYALTSG